jgi:hypothetical protein
MWSNDKKFQICTVGLEFKSRRASLVKDCDSQGFTRSSRPMKFAFQIMGFFRIQKKKNIDSHRGNCLVEKQTRN